MLNIEAIPKDLRIRVLVLKERSIDEVNDPEYDQTFYYIIFDLDMLHDKTSLEIADTLYEHYTLKRVVWLLKLLEYDRETINKFLTLYSV